MTSYIETFLMPYSEIEKRFRKSELALLGWRSSERAANMDRRMQESRSSYKAPEAPIRSGKKRPAGTLPGALPESCFNEDGEPDMRKCTSAQAIRYLRTAGFTFYAPPDVEAQIEEMGDQEIGYTAPRLAVDKIEIDVDGSKLSYNEG